MKKEWKDVPGFDGRYRVSNLGVVLSTGGLFEEEGRFGKRLVQKRKKKLRPYSNQDGYMLVKLYSEKYPKGLGTSVHRLVLESFVGPCPEGMEACHKDGNPANNKLSNLRWDTPKKNMEDRERHGRHVKGSDSYRAVLHEEDIPTIRYLLQKYSRRGTMSAIARLFKVTTSAIKEIRDGHTWKHCPEIATNYDGPPLEFGEIWKGGGKGRGPKGETHPFAKMNEEKVRLIRSKYATGKYSYSELAKEFKCHFVTISDIVTRKTWKSVD